MDSGEQPVIGYDLGAGGGDKAAELPCVPFEIPLVNANANYTALEPGGIRVVDIWGLDPRLVVAVSFQRVHRKNDPNSFNPGNLTATINAFTLARTSDGVQQIAQIPSAQLFLNGGNLDVSGNDDGCEINSAAQGIRLELIWLRSAATSHNVTAIVQARPNVALGCSDLLRKIAKSLTVQADQPQTPGA